MSTLKLTPILYHLEMLAPHITVTVKAVKFDKNQLPIIWAVYRNDSYRLNKETGQFDYEPMPANRNDEFIRTHSFNIAEAAVAFYKKTIDVRKEEREYYVSLKR
jgi:hypothetical protein